MLCEMGFSERKGREQVYVILRIERTEVQKM